MADGNRTLGSFNSFGPALTYFRDKVNMPTERWDDLWQGEHARAFVSAGATSEDLLVDLRNAVDKAVSQQISYDQFRREFDDIVTRHGWQHNGSPGWRSRVIYHTNVRTSQMAGRYAQMTDPDTLAYMPYWRYRHNPVTHPREEHAAWNGLIIRADSPWWSTHYPPNGWGCNCSVEPVSEAGLRRAGKDGPDEPPTPVNDPTIPAEWRYSVGEAAYGKPIADDVMDDYRKSGAAAWEDLTPGSPTSAGRPERVPLDPAPEAAEWPRLGPDERDVLEGMLENMLGGPERVFSVTGENGWRNDLQVVASSLAQHINPTRSEYLPWLPSLLSDPFEVWQGFERHAGTGQVVLRQRYIRAFDVPGEKKGMLLVATARRGRLESWTVVPSTRRYLENQRRGRLVYGRPTK